MKRYETRYYFMYTDLDLDTTREAYIRMDAMAEEYRRRTRGFRGSVRAKMPFYLFSKRQDYYNSGGPVGTGGVFMGSKLMAVASSRGGRTWHVVQHEGFHQFARAAIGGQIPAWLNEGLAEYFGEGVFTGDGFVFGFVPPHRLRALKQYIRTNKLKPFSEMMSMSYQKWVSKISSVNYIQAWSMLHFLVHGKDGKYVKATSAFMSDLGRGMPYVQAWVKNFGRDIEGFEKEYRQYWLSQPPDPTAKLRDHAVVCTITSFFARASSQGQAFEDPAAFFQKAEAGELAIHRSNWLPPSLLRSSLPKAKKLGQWSIEPVRNARPQLICRVADGRKYVGTFAVQGNGKLSVNVAVHDKDEPEAASKPASTNRSAATQP